ncbi:MAG TPA: hypothetical protein VF681_01665 [Abditibacteriaceae bacterium]|jgi:hypothetical protein
MPQKYFWAGFLSRICYLGAIVAIGLFVVTAAITQRPFWEIFLGSVGLAIQGLFWDILTDIGGRLYRVENEQTFLRRWVQKDDK